MITTGRSRRTLTVNPLSIAIREGPIDQVLLMSFIQAISSTVLVWEMILRACAWKDGLFQ